MFSAIIFLLAGLAVLVFSADILVRGASSLASKLGVSTLVIGLTVVSFGTSAPELIVNVLSALRGSPNLAIGNIIGSNIANILLILGVSAIIVNLKVQSSTIWKEIPFAFLAILIIWVMSNDTFFDRTSSNVITRTDGIALIGFFSIFIYHTFHLAKSSRGQDQGKTKTYSSIISILMTLGGIIGLFLGGKTLVDNAAALARLAGLSEMLVGLTIVAIGTSLPELATSAIAAWKGYDDIAVGNIVGSNIFNIFFVLGTTGITSIVKPLSVPSQINFDMAVCSLATLMLFLAVFVGQKKKIEHWQGALFVFLYVCYIVYSIIRG